MKCKIQLWLIGIVVMLASNAMASDQTALSCSAADIQAAIDTCISTGGGTITVPACDFESVDSNGALWTPGDAISVSHTETEYRIVGQGRSHTRIGFSNDAEPKGVMWKFLGPGIKEFAGMYLAGSPNMTNVGVGNKRKHSPLKFYSRFNGTFIPDGPTDTYVHDIETNNFSSRSQICHTKNMVFQNCIFNQLLDGNEYHFDAYDTADMQWGEDGNIYPSKFGSRATDVNAFFENCKFYGAHHLVSTFVRARVVIRYCEAEIGEWSQGDNAGSFDAHEPGYGCCGDDGLPDADSYYHGGQSYEIYNNRFTRTGDQIGSGYAVRVRSGYNIVTGNYIENQGRAIEVVLDNQSTGGLCTEDNGYARDNTISTDSGGHGGACNAGQGCCDSPEYNYFWGNTYMNNDVDGVNPYCGGRLPGPCAEAMKEDTHYFLRAPNRVDDGFSWEMYPCPHPVTGLTGECGVDAGRESYNIGGNNTGAPPTIIGIADQKVVLNAAFDFDLSDYVIEPDSDEITYSLDGGSDPLPDGLVLNADGTISGTPTEVCVRNVAIRVTDKDGQAAQNHTDSFVLTVVEEGNNGGGGSGGGCFVSVF